jgi:hypothetical protein
VKPEIAIRDAFRALVGEPVELPNTNGRTVEDLIRQYGGTAGVAEAAGFGTAAEAKAAGPAAVRARETFMRDLRRYRQGTRRPSAAMRALFDLEPSTERPANLREVVELIDAYGLTWVGECWVYISEDWVLRSWPEPGWWISPAIWAWRPSLGPDVRGRHWPETVIPLGDCMSVAYMGGLGMVLDDVEELSFAIGRTEGARAVAVEP